MKFKPDENTKFNIFIFTICMIVSYIITFETVYYSGYTEQDSAVMKKIDNLVTMLNDSNNNNEQLSKEVLKLEKEIFELKHGLKPQEMSPQLKELYEQTGLLDTTGKGLVIYLVEPKKDKNSEDFSGDIQSDDLLKLVNVLHASGAKAISINNERLIMNSEIISAGKNIVINGRTVSAPFTVKVLGDYQTINSALNMKGGIVDYFGLFGITVNIEKHDSLTLPKYKNR